MATTVPFSNPASYQQWAQDLEAYAGLPQTAQETTLISAWEQSENPVSQVGGYTPQGGFNALNTSRTTDAAGTHVASGLEPGSSFIPVFPNVTAALAATTATLHQQNYAPELAALQQQSDAGLVSALGASGHVWGSSPSLVASILHTGPSTASSGSGGGPTTATLTAAPGGALDPLNWPGDILGPVTQAGGGAIASGILGVIGAVTDPLKRWVEDAGLVVLGIILFFVALVLIAHGASSGGGGGTTVVREEETSKTSGGYGRAPEESETHTVEREKEPPAAHETPAGPVSSSGEGRAMEAEAEEAPKAAVVAAG